MASKESKKRKQYIALVQLTSDKRGRKWQPGDIVKPGDFDPAVLDSWLEIGAIEEVDDGGHDIGKG